MRLVGADGVLQGHGEDVADDRETAHVLPAGIPMMHHPVFAVRRGLPDLLALRETVGPKPFTVRPTRAHADHQDVAFVAIAHSRAGDEEVRHPGARSSDDALVMRRRGQSQGEGVSLGTKSKNFGPAVHSTELGHKIGRILGGFPWSRLHLPSGPGNRCQEQRQKYEESFHDQQGVCVHPVLPDPSRFLSRKDSFPLRSSPTG